MGLRRVNASVPLQLSLQLAHIQAKKINSEWTPVTATQGLECYFLITLEHINSHTHPEVLQEHFGLAVPTESAAEFNPVAQEHHQYFPQARVPLSVNLVSDKKGHLDGAASVELSGNEQNSTLSPLQITPEVRVTKRQKY